jgi:protein TonB
MSLVTKKIPVCTSLESATVLALVLLMHGAVILFWLMRPAQQGKILNEISVAMYQSEEAIAVAARHHSPVERLKTPNPERKIQKAVDTLELPVTSPATHDVSPVHQEDSTAADKPADIVNIEPDYKASYLNNLQPAYPVVAQSMGWQGRVVLNVEVLADGACGAVSIQHGSGHGVLDNAALSAVKSWHFSPARRAGRNVTQWFLVPIVFSLEDKSA